MDTIHRKKRTWSTTKNGHDPQIKMDRVVNRTSKNGHFWFYSGCRFLGTLPLELRGLSLWLPGGWMSTAITCMYKFNFATRVKYTVLRSWFIKCCVLNEIMFAVRATVYMKWRDWFHILHIIYSLNEVYSFVFAQAVWLWCAFIWTEG